MSLNFSDGARYNNMLPLTANPYKHSLQLFGQTRTTEIIQFPDFGIGGVLWDCELVLAAYLSGSRMGTSRLNCRSVVELGSGTGLAALVAWQLGAFAVATDLPDVVAHVTTPNVTHNVASVKRQRAAAIHAAPLSWGNRAEGDAVTSIIGKAAAAGLVVASAKVAKGRLIGHPGSASATLVPVDFLIAADVIYHSDQHAPLLDTILQLLGPQSVFVFTHRRRFENDSNFLEPLMEILEMKSATPVADVLPAYPKANLTIYEFQRRVVPSVAASPGSGSKCDTDPPPPAE